VGKNCYEKEMRKYLILLVTFLVVQSLCAQEFYLLMGVNFTKYDYKNALGQTNENINNGRYKGHC